MIQLQRAPKFKDLREVTTLIGRATHSAPFHRSARPVHPSTLPKLGLGVGVLFPGDQSHIAVGNLRGSSLHVDVSLHRLLLESPRHRLWDYVSEKELLQGIRAALSAHEFMCKQGILHREVSADFSRHNSDTIHATTETIVPGQKCGGGGMTAPTAARKCIIFAQDVFRGAAMTGTALCMATEILQGIIRGTSIEHEPEHDIESFIYLAYSVTKKAVIHSHNLDMDIREELHSHFRSNFGRMTYDVGCRSDEKSTHAQRRSSSELESTEPHACNNQETCYANSYRPTREREEGKRFAQRSEHETPKSDLRG
ncbi:hypothetical protein M413DRAFT_32914 [Hebeloma cylindrosporum]|uniref:Fungal-type protein kinase domain-containing protein n=1 Tax=Hebeloma cylindrosporum TaxID=76867 RepID=A0A0C2Y1F8_HEBCY|nr:hypothetical protein M413DRAFT_32914 [Hebeloma cylindrosporum h7]